MALYLRGQHMYEELRGAALPAHIAIIMDGNGRWASRRMLPRLAGHNAGMKAMTEIVRACSDIGIKYLTVYAFSTENWKRSAEEVGGIFDLLVKYVAKELAELKENNVRVRVLGDYSIIPEAARESLELTLSETAENTGLQFNIALNYGSRAEITRAVNAILSERLRSGSAEPVTDAEIAAHLYTGEENGNVPDPDLIIRTSGEERISNFLLWQCAYSEFAFTDTLWPDFTPEMLSQIILDYGKRERRFGGRK